MSKTIEIHRHFNLVEMSQEDPQVKAWLGESYRPIGPYFDGKAVATGLSFTEQNLLMPDVLGIEKTDKDFRKAVTNFFHELVTNIPKTGLTLEIGLEDDTKGLGETNLPLNTKDYIIYRHALKHPNVASNKTEAEKYIIKRFYIVDPNQVSLDAMKLNTLEDKAQTLYFKFKDDITKVDQVLTMMGVNIRKMGKNEKVIELKRLSKSDTTLGGPVQKERLSRFIQICEDSDLEMKYLIQELIGFQVLQQVGTHILLTENGEKIGDNMQDAVLYLKNPKNSRILNLLKSEYQMKSKKSILEEETKESTKTQESEA